MMFKHFGTHPVRCLVVLAAIGCAERSEGPRVPATGPDLGAPHVAWHDKTHEEQAAFMGAHVEPEMRKLFTEYDASGYEDFGCPTCHGANMDLVDFEMPNDIYALPADNPIGEAMDYDPEVAQFMMGKVLPTMAKLLSEPAGKPEGVTCHTCHPEE